MLNPIIGEGLSEATASEVGYEPKGYELLDEVKLECLGCNKQAVSLIVVKEGQEYPESIFQLKCKKCGQLSFKKKFSMKKIYYGEIEPFKILDIETIPTWNNNKLIKLFTLLEVKPNE